MQCTDFGDIWCAIYCLEWVFLRQEVVHVSGKPSELRALSWAVAHRSFINFNYIIQILSIYNVQNNELFVYISSVGGVASSLTELCVCGGGGGIKILQLVLLCSLSSARKKWVFFFHVELVDSLSLLPLYTPSKFQLAGTRFHNL